MKNVNTSNRRLTSIVQEILARDFPEMGNAGWEWEGKIIQEDYEVTVIRIQVISQRGVQVYCVKDWNEKNSDRAANEAAALSKFQEVFVSNPRLFVPRLVVYDPDRKYVATEYFNGATYRTVLLRNCLFPSKYQKLLECSDQIVDWLRCFQAINANEKAKIDTEDLDREFSSRLSFCFEQRLLSQHMLEYIKESYKPWLVDVQDTEFKIVPVHGDFGPVNILIGKTGVCAVDFSEYHYGAIHIDVSYMWASLLAMSKYHVFGRVFLNDLINRFLSESHDKLNIYMNGLKLEAFRILIKRMYDGVRFGIRKNQKGHLAWIGRAYFYRSLIVNFLKEMRL